MSGPADRLALLRRELEASGLDGFYLPRTDQYGSEYLPADSERVAWLTGFTGSAAVVIVLKDRAAIFSDGRYTVQLQAEVDGSLFERCHLIEQPPGEWLANNAAPDSQIGYDPMLVRRAEVQRLTAHLERSSGKLSPLPQNPIDRIWIDRPGPPQALVSLQDEAHAGMSSRNKRARIGGAVQARGASALLVTAADSIAWLLNIRGRDIPFNPLCLSHLLLDTDGTCTWFVDRAKLPEGLQLDNAIRIEEPDRLFPHLDALSGRKVQVDPMLVHEGYLQRLEKAGATLVSADDPIVLAKACKNAVEIEGAIDAQRRDGAAVANFLGWLDAQASGSVDEHSAAEKLLECRARDPLFQGESFPAISAYGPHASLPHYRCTSESNVRLDAGSVYLIDSGGQYLDATTDITRTVAIGEVHSELRQRFTLVLKGHIAIDQAVFPVGTSGAQIDSLARFALWRHGLDFDHGTGHGVGAFLCVHEGPARISKAGHVKLEPGMILSNEPGYYKSDAYGIRIENLLLVEERGTPAGGDRPLLGFRSLTLCPIDRRLIATELLDPAERAWIDAYHARVLQELEPLMGDDVRPWLRQACSPL